MQNQIILPPLDSQEHLHIGHFGLVAFVAVSLLGISYFKNPGLFDFGKNTNNLLSANMPRYYAYQEPAAQPMVAGASTAVGGPSIINEDGSVTPVDTGSVLGASTENVQLSLDQIAVKEIPDSPEAVNKYFSDSQTIESGYINNSDFQAALTSGDQQQINNQALKLSQIKDSLGLLLVPHSLVNLQKLKIAQYQAGVGLLNNFTKADDNPELVGQYLDQFLKSQQDMDNENLAAQQKFGVDLGYTAPASDDGSLSQQYQANSNQVDDSNAQ